MADREKQLDRIRREYGNIEAYIAEQFGADVPFSIVGDFCLVHMDQPEEWMIQKRIAEFEPKNHLPDDCPICELEREIGGFIVFNESESDEEIDLESDVDNEDSEPPPMQMGIWKRSYIDLDGLSGAPREMLAAALIQNVWSNLVELREDAEHAEDTSRDSLRRLESAYRLFAKEAYLTINSKQGSVRWTDIRSLYEAARHAAQELHMPSMEEKKGDVEKKIEALANVIQEIIIRVSLN